MRRLTVLLAALSVAGCSLFRSDPKPKIAPLPEIKSPLAVRTLWSLELGTAGASTLTPAIADKAVFAAARDGSVVRVDAASGKVLWRTATGIVITGGVGADGETVVVGSNEGEVVALDAGTGIPRWRARVSSEVLAPPAVSGDVVVVRCSDSRMFALEARDGRRRWVYQRAMPTLTVRSAAGAAVREGSVFAGFSGGRLVALALNNGGARWEAPVALPRGSTELERVADVVGLPWASEREVCAVAYQGRVACFDASGGQPLWSRDVSSVSGLGVDGRFLFVSDDKGAVLALDRGNGTSFWKQDRLSLRELSAPLGLGAQVAVGDLEGFVHLLSRDTGDFVARVATDGSRIAGPLVPIAGGFLAQTQRGNLFAFAAPVP